MTLTMTIVPPEYNSVKTPPNPNYFAMSKGDLVAIIESQKTVIQRFYRLLPVSNKVLAPGEKLAWAVAKPLIDREKPNEQGLVRIPIDEIAEKIGMSDSSASRYIANICERFDATHQVEPYITKKGQQCNLTYIDPSDPIWATSPDELPLPAEKERTINGNECPHCHSSNTLRAKKRTIATQDITECEVCGYTKVYPVVQVNDPLPPMEYCPPKKALQAGEPFPESSEPEKGPQPEDLFSSQAPAEKVENLHCLPVDTVPLAAQELHALPQWVVWRYEEPEKPRADGKLTKVPYNARPARSPQKADSTNPATWTSYEQARATFEDSKAWKRPYSGVGFVFNHNGIVGIDQDGSLDPRIHSYTERSVSGDGIHTFARGTIPRNVKRPGIEMYDHARFFCWTGDHLAGTPGAIEDCQAELDALYKELVPEISNRLENHGRVQNFTSSSSDDEILKKARGAANGAKFIALYDQGNWKACGYPSQSEADQGLCEMLLYWGDGDVSTIDRLFPHSELMRDKWKRADYREDTISKALQFYQQRERRAS